MFQELNVVKQRYRAVLEVGRGVPVAEVAGRRADPGVATPNSDQMHATSQSRCSSLRTTGHYRRGRFGGRYPWVQDLDHHGRRGAADELGRR
jgi:hypothetical protein